MKKYISIIISMFVLLVMVMTNPKKADYVNWLKEQEASQTQDVLEKGIIALLGNSVIESSTQTKNLIFFSMYDTNIDSEESIRVIGICNNFFKIKTFTIRTKDSIFQTEN